MAQPAAQTPARSRGMLFAGIAIAAVGIGAGAVMFGLSGSTEESTIEKFARAPAGCTTTLQFDKTGVFTLYTETKGSVGNPGGDCAGNGGSYEHADDDLPRATLSLVDEAGTPQTLVDAGGADYDTGSYRGQATQQVQIAAKGAYRLTVTSDATDFAIAIGGAPDADSSSMRSAGLGAAAAGLLAGGLLIVLGLRKKGGATGAPAAAGWSPTPAGVPGATPQYGTVPGYQPQQPGYSQQPSVPGYQPQQPSYPQQPGYPQQPAYPTQQPTVPGYQPQAPAAPQPSVPGWAPQQPATPTEQHEPPSVPPAPPQGPGWGAPQQ